MSLTSEEREVLATCLRRQRALEAVPDILGIFPRWAWYRDEHELQLEKGPAFDSGDWFGPGLAEFKRQRYVRAAKRLAAAGLLEAHKEGRRLSHVKLTAEGEKKGR